MAGERDSALNKAQEMADRLVEAERDRDSLQEVVVKANREIEKLQDELEDISKRYGGGWGRGRKEEGGGGRPRREEEEGERECEGRRREREGERV